jgi:MoxR-like ATPase
MFMKARKSVPTHTFTTQNHAGQQIVSIDEVTEVQQSQMSALQEEFEERLQH